MIQEWSEEYDDEEVVWPFRLSLEITGLGERAPASLFAVGRARGCRMREQMVVWRGNGIWGGEERGRWDVAMRVRVYVM